MKLNVTTETVHTVDYRELERFIKQETGRDYEFVAMEELSNGSNYVTVVDGEMTNYDRVQFEKWINGDNVALMYQTHILLNKMATVGMIEKGKYVIEVSW